MQLTAQDLFQKSREQWLEEARHTAHKLLSQRYSITIEDVLKHCPRPDYLHRNVTGNVFNSQEFKAIGFSPSKRKQSHGRIVRVWTKKPGFTVPRDRDYEEADSY